MVVEKGDAGGNSKVGTDETEEAAEKLEDLSICDPASDSKVSTQSINQELNFDANCYTYWILNRCGEILNIALIIN